MKKLACLIALISVLAFTSTDAFADIALEATPKSVKSKEFDSSLTIRLDRDAKEAKLIVPRKMAGQFRAALDEADDATVAASVSGGSTQTIVAGLLISLALGFGGVWLIRSQTSASRNSKIAAAVVFLLAGGAAATVVFANIPPPRPVARSITGKLFDKNAFQPYGYAAGKIKVEISDAAAQVELRVPAGADNEKNEE